MESKLSIFLVVAIMAMAAAVPLLSTDADASDIFSYKSQLDENGLCVYKEVAGLETIVNSDREFEVEFTDTILYSDESKAKQYADKTVQNALAAAYYSNPMVPYLWDYPVKKVEVEVTILTATDKDTGIEYYAAQKVSFTLTVPEGITAESLKELDDAIEGYKIKGDTDADKVSNMMSQLDKLRFKEDEEGKISNIYDALVKNETSSAGVAQALMQFCILNNIPAIIVAGDNMKAEKEDKSFWNYVYLEGDHDGTAYYAWYVVDSAYCVSSGICGYQTSVDYDDSSYSMSALLNTDLNLSSDNDLKVPELNDEKYVRVGGPSFLELHGEKVMLAAIGAVIVLGMFYAVRKGIY